MSGKLGGRDTRPSVMPRKRVRQRTKDRSLDPAFKSLIPLFNQLYEAQKKAKKLGIFVGDRELLTCPKCGLHEDVAFSGMLQVTMPPHLGEDTGLRFKTARRRPARWRCPACKKEFKALK